MATRTVSRADAARDHADAAIHYAFPTGGSTSGLPNEQYASIQCG
jgi:hypothetical protein